ncbi:MAG: sulfatase [Eubacteriales bacterium]
MSNSKPNVVIINCDDLGYGDLGCYGSKINKSPYLDKLAKESMVFTSCYAASPVCSPSRAGLLTGCYPPRVGIDRVLYPVDPLGLSKEEFTMSQMFKNAGYSTAIVGKWHCGDQKEFLPCEFGFNSYYGLPYSNDMGMMEKREDKLRFPPLPLIAGSEVIEEQPDQRSLTERYVEKCVEFIRENENNNFFLYFAQMHVHLPHYAADRFVRESENGDFGACVGSLDWASGTIIFELEKLNLLDNTIVIFTSDNGSRGDRGASNFPLKGGKFTTWEGGLRIPFIMYWKSKIAPCVNDKMASHIDLLPTFASILGESLGEKMIDGLDLSDMILNGSESQRDEFVYYASGSRLEAVRKKNWKLHLYKKGEPVKLLFDLDKDVSEDNNLYDDYPGIVKELTEIYLDYSSKLGDSLTGTIGTENRPCGFTENPVALTVYDPEHPYIIAEYDKNDVG